MRSNVPPITFGLVALLCAGATAPTVPAAHRFTVPLDGRSEVSRAKAISLAGDPDGSGLVRLSVDPDDRRICYDFDLSGVATPLMAHIHKGSEQSNGPSVVTLFTGPGALENCVDWTEKWLAEIVANPSGFYVNVYTTEFPDGAVRGQL